MTPEMYLLELTNAITEFKQRIYVREITVGMDSEERTLYAKMMIFLEQYKYKLERKERSGNNARS